MRTLCAEFVRTTVRARLSPPDKVYDQDGRMKRSFHLAVVGHLYTYRCHCRELYTG